jgi:hypothetical protein
MDVVAWETASGGQSVECPGSLQSCTASFRFAGKAGAYDIDVEYFAQNNGTSKFRVYVGNHLVGEWLADAHLPSNKPDGDSDGVFRELRCMPEMKSGSRAFPMLESARRWTTSRSTRRDSGSTIDRIA